MTANTNPIFTLTPNIGFGGILATAADDFTGVSANNALCFTAGANGSYIDSVLLNATGTNIPSTARIFINNGSSHTTAANNQFIGEQALPNYSLTSGVPVPQVGYQFNFAIPAGYTIYVGLTVSVAGGWAVAVIGGDY